MKKNNNIPRGEKTRIFLDMDGVCTNFVKAVIEALGQDYDEVIDRWPEREYSIYKVLGCSRDEMWDAIDKGGSDFWRFVEPYSWYNELWSMAQAFAPGLVFYLSAPPIEFGPSGNRNGLALLGKLQWIWKNHNHPEGFDLFTFTNQKHLLAKKGAILIDDNEGKVNGFRNHGGDAILFPQPWNRDGHFAQFSSVMFYVYQELCNITDTHCDIRYGTEWNYYGTGQPSR